MQLQKKPRLNKQILIQAAGVARVRWESEQTSVREKEGGGGESEVIWESKERAIARLQCLTQSIRVPFEAHKTRLKIIFGCEIFLRPMISVPSTYGSSFVVYFLYGYALHIFMYMFLYQQQPTTAFRDTQTHSTHTHPQIRHKNPSSCHTAVSSMQTSN